MKSYIEYLTKRPLDPNLPYYVYYLPESDWIVIKQFPDFCQKYIELGPL